MSHRNLLPEDPLEQFLSENDVLMPRTVPAGEEPQGSTGVPDFQLPASEVLETLTGAALLAALASSLLMLAPPQPGLRPSLAARTIPQTLMLAPSVPGALVASQPVEAHVGRQVCSPG
jgi:hypothetical protein